MRTFLNSSRYVFAGEYSVKIFNRPIIFILPHPASLRRQNFVLREERELGMSFSNYANPKYKSPKNVHAVGKPSILSQNLELNPLCCSLKGPGKTI